MPKLGLKLRICRAWEYELTKGEGSGDNRSRGDAKGNRVCEMANLALLVVDRIAMPVARSLKRERQSGHDDKNGEKPLCCSARHK